MSKPKLDFQILKNDDPRYILVADISEWNHIKELPSIIEVTVPGSKEPIVYYYSKNTITSLNSVNLYLNCGTGCGCDGEDHNFLPDGIYNIKIKGSPDTFFREKKHLQTAKLRLELDKMYIKANLDSPNSDLSVNKNFERIDLLLTAAEANIRQDNVNTAYDLYTLASELVKSC